MNTQPTWSDSPIHEQIRTMNDTPTPETDKHEFPCMTWPSQDHPMVVRSDFARKLERELTATTEERDEAREALKDYLSAFGLALKDYMGEQQVEADANARKALQSLTPNEL